MLGELIITALVFSVILFSKSATSICNEPSKGLETTSFPPAFSTKTLYSVKKGAKTTHSSPSLKTAFKDMESDAAAPQVTYISFSVKLRLKSRFIFFAIVFLVLRSPCADV